MKEIDKMPDIFKQPRSLLEKATTNPKFVVRKSMI